MIYYILITILCIIITFIISYYLPKGKIQQANTELEKQEKEQQLKIKELETEYLQKEKELNSNFQTLNTEIEQKKANAALELIKQKKELEIEIHGLEERKKAMIDSIKEESKIYKEQQLTITEQEIEKTTSEIINNYNGAIQEAKENYLTLLEESVKEYNEKIAISKEEFETQMIQLLDIQSKVNAAVQASKREELNRQQKDFYRIQISDIDIEEIKRIKSIEPYLRNKEPLNKVIWKVYYEKPLNSMIGRVIGNKTITGIYKITNLNNNMCYVGQAVDIAARVKQHVKRGLGAETPTRNKLYPAMSEFGVENFTFEVIEECEAKDLNEREDYWQEFFHSIEFGYSIK